MVCQQLRSQGPIKTTLTTTIIIITLSKDRPPLIRHLPPWRLLVPEVLATTTVPPRERPAPNPLRPRASVSRFINRPLPLRLQAQPHPS